MKRILMLFLFTSITFGQIQKPAYLWYSTAKGDSISIIPSTGKLVQTYIFGLTDTVAAHRTALDLKLTGSGTINYLSKYTATGLVQGNSQLHEDADGNVFGSNLDKRLTDWRNSDYMLANHFGLTYQDENSQIVTLSVNTISGLVYARGYLFACSYGSGKIIRFNNLNDLTDYTVVSPAVGSFADIIYVPSVGKLYALSLTTGIRVTEIDPITLDNSTVISNGQYTQGESLTSDGNYLYVLTYSCVVLKYSLSDFSRTGTVPIRDVDNGHALRYDGTSLYATGTTYPGWIAKVDTALSVISQMNFTSGDNNPTDDLCSVGDYIFVGLESSNGVILRIKKSDLSITRLATTMASSCYGTFFDGRYVWGLYATTANKLVRIDPTNLECVIYNFLYNSSFVSPNEMFTDGQRFYVTGFTSPAKIARFSVPHFDGNRYFLDTLTNYYMSFVGTKVGIKTSAPDSIFTVTGGANISGGLKVTQNATIGGTLGVTGTTTLATALTGTIRAASGVLSATASDTVGLGAALGLKANLATPIFTGKITTDSITSNGSGYFGGVITNTARVGIKNGLLANVVEKYNSRGLLISSEDSVGTPTYKGLGAGTVRSSSAGLFSSTVSDTVGLGVALYNKLSGSGTANTISKYTAGLTLGNSLITDDGTNVGVGFVSGRTLGIYAASNTTFQVTNSASGTASTDGFTIQQSGANTYLDNREDGALAFQTNNTQWLTLSSTGTLGLGMGASATSRFAIQNGLLANVVEWYNSRGLPLGVLDSISNLGLGSTIPLHRVVGVESYTTNLNAFNFVDSDVNLSRLTVAQATDTSSVNLAFSGAGSPIFKIIGKTGNKILVADSAGIKGDALEIPHLTKKAASANIRNSHDAEASCALGGYTKVKTIVITNGLVGQVRVLFDLKIAVTTGSPTAYGRVYKNGVALGTEQTNATTDYVTKSEDITQTWNPGDLCQLYLHYGGAGTGTAWCQNFRLAYDDSPTVTVSSSNTTP
jgi:hypothetical protein